MKRASTRWGVSLESRMGSAYNHKIENSLTRNLAGPGILPRQEAHRVETGKAYWRKNTKKGTYVRPVIVYRDKNESVF